VPTPDAAVMLGAAPAPTYALAAVTLDVQYTASVGTPWPSAVPSSTGDPCVYPPATHTASHGGEPTTPLAGSAGTSGRVK
jgi:hypothetical protein